MYLKTHEISTGKERIRELINSDSVHIDYNSETGQYSINVQVEAGLGLDIGSLGLKIDVDDLIEILRGKSCCHTDVFYEKISSSGNTVSMDTVPSNLKLHGDPCFYFKVRFEGAWGVASSDNDQSIDFSSSPNNKLFVQLLTRSTPTGSWTKSISRQIDYSSGSTITWDFETNFLSDTLLYVVPNISRYDDVTLTDIVNPIANYSNYWIRLTITKCLKTSWFKLFDIPATALDGVNPKTGNIPSTSGEGLPFQGIYEVHAYVNVVEEINAGQADANVADPQYFKVKGYGGSYKEICKSGRFIPATGFLGDKWMNYSLQGSISINITDSTIANRVIQYEVTLPNGVNKQIVSGYMLVHYLGTSEGNVST